MQIFSYVDLDSKAYKEALMHLVSSDASRDENLYRTAVSIVCNNLYAEQTFQQAIPSMDDAGYSK